jgi:hypothetical protein
MSPRSAIVVIDLLKGFFKSNPTLPDPLDAKRLFATVRRVIDAAANAASPSSSSRTTFCRRSANRQALQDLRPGTASSAPPTPRSSTSSIPKPGDFQIQKKHCSAFQFDAARRRTARTRRQAAFLHGRLDRSLRPAHRDRRIHLNYDISVISVRSPHRTGTPHDYALNYMRQYHRAKIITSDQALAQFRTDAAARRRR